MAASEEPRTDVEFSFTRLIGTGISGKLLIDTGTQIFNPFLQIIAQGMGIDVITLGRLMGVRSAMGLFAPLFGSVADQRGYRKILQIGLVLNAVGFVFVGISNSLVMVLIGMVLAGLGMSSFVPTLHAYMSHRLDYSIRARGLGMIEYSWALTGIIGLFLMGLVIEATGWRAPFFILAVGMLVMAVVFGQLPPARHEEVDVINEPRTRTVRSTLRHLRNFLDLGPNWRSTYANMVAGALMFFAGMQFMVMYGTWLGTEYGLNAAQLGLVALVFGVFDLVASVSVSLITDTIGKWRSVFIGAVGSLVGYLLMPFLNIGLFAAVGAIVLSRAFFEFGIVSNFPLLSEQVPEKRGKVMTLSAAIGLMGATLASFTAPPLFTTHGVIGISATSAIASVLAIAVLLLFVRENYESETTIP